MRQGKRRIKGCCSLCGRPLCNGGKNWVLAKIERKATGQKRRFTKGQDGW